MITRPDPEAVVCLLVKVLAGSPRLSGGLCRGRPELFDADNDEQAAQAAELCRRCPALDRCADWFDSLPKRKRPHGVVAGQINQGPPEDRERRPRGRPRKVVSS